MSSAWAGKFCLNNKKSDYSSTSVKIQRPKFSSYAGQRLHFKVLLVVSLSNFCITLPAPIWYFDRIAQAILKMKQADCALQSKNSAANNSHILE